MILMLQNDDRALVLFGSPADAYRRLEAIDIENDEYEFCDEQGQRLLGVVTRSGGMFRSGSFELRPDGPPDPNNALNLLDRAVRLEANPWHQDLTALRRHLTGA